MELDPFDNVPTPAQKVSTSTIPGGEVGGISSKVTTTSSMAGKLEGEIDPVTSLLGGNNTTTTSNNADVSAVPDLSTGRAAPAKVAALESKVAASNGPVGEEMLFFCILYCPLLQLNIAIHCLDIQLNVLFIKSFALYLISVSSSSVVCWMYLKNCSHLVFTIIATKHISQ